MAAVFTSSFECTTVTEEAETEAEVLLPQEPFYFSRRHAQACGTRSRCLVLPCLVALDLCSWPLFVVSASMCVRPRATREYFFHAFRRARRVQSVWRVVLMACGLALDVLYMPAKAFALAILVCVSFTMVTQNDSI